MRQKLMTTSRWRLLALSAWAASAIIVTVFVVIGDQALYGDIQSQCTGAVAKECAYLQINAPMAESLRQVGLSLDTFALLVVCLDSVPPLVALIVSGLLIFRRTHDRMAVLAGIVLLLFVGTVLQSGVNALANRPGWSWPVTLVQFIGAALLLSFLNMFPDGRFAPPWARWIALGWIGWCVIGYFSPTDWPVSQRPPGSHYPIGVVPFFLTTLAAQVIRYFRYSSDTQRQQTKWVLLGFSLSLGAILTNVLVLPRFIPPPPQPAAGLYLLIGGASFTLALLLMPVSVALAVLRYRLFDVDLLISRALIYVGLSGAIVVVYVVVVGYLGAVFQTGSNLPISVLAAAAVAIVFQPLRARLQRLVNRLVYGERDDPYSVLSRLGKRLEGSLPAESVLPAVVQTVAEALKLPYAAIMLAQTETNEMMPAATFGHPADRTERFPLMYGNEMVGELRLAPRSGSGLFGTSDRRLLADIARQAGVAAHALRLSVDLQRSRERLVASREEERRRLRRDLHDGLGPMLAAQALKVGSARALYSRDHASADQLLLQLENDIESTLEQIRQIARDLRPPALDQLGLVEALREIARRYEPRLHSSLTLGGELCRLPAGAEVAVYRIVEEALTNVVRHASAQHCQVRVERSGGCLYVEVADDGIGLQPGSISGVGLTSMRERAEELGGSFSIEPQQPRGTRIRAEIPSVGATAEA